MTYGVVMVVKIHGSMSYDLDLHHNVDLTIDHMGQGIILIPPIFQTLFSFNIKYKLCSIPTKEHQWDLWLGRLCGVIGDLEVVGLIPIVSTKFGTMWVCRVDPLLAHFNMFAKISKPNNVYIQSLFHAKRTLPEIS